MAQYTRHEKLHGLLAKLSLNVSQLSRISGVDHSLISKWLRGERPLTRRSRLLQPMVQGLLAADKTGKLNAVLAPYRQQGESALEAMCAYLTQEDLPTLAPRASPAQRQLAGEYTVQYRVFLGRRGHCTALLTLLDYLLTLPPRLELFLLCHDPYVWLSGEPAFVVQFLNRLQDVFLRGSRLTLISRGDFAGAKTPTSSLPWLAAHLRGYIRSYYFVGDLPDKERYVASIPGYASLYACEDAEVEDGLFTTLHTDVLDMRQHEEVCRAALQKSFVASQYHFLTYPNGHGEDVRRWREGIMPFWEDTPPPMGNFSMLVRTPGFGIITHSEFAKLCGDAEVSFPAYLLCAGGAFAPGPHRIILCREEIQQNLSKKCRLHKPLSALLHRKVYIPQSMLRAQLLRLLDAMDQRDDFEIALMPQVAFEKIQLELICWQHSASMAWLPDGHQSMLGNESAICRSLYTAMDYLWQQLLAGWRQPQKVRRQLRKWLAGQELDLAFTDSAVVRGWRPAK